MLSHPLGRGKAGSRGRRIARLCNTPAMPELPEVETVKRRLAPHLEGRALSEVTILDDRLTAPEPPEAVAAALTGDTVELLDRRSKYLLLRLASGRVLAVHLRMTGNLLWQTAQGAL